MGYFESFDQWWDCAGSGLRPNNDQDQYAHAKFVANCAWAASEIKNKTDIIEVLIDKLEEMV